MKDSLDLLSKALKPALRVSATMPHESDLETLFQLDFYSKLMVGNRKIYEMLDCSLVILSHSAMRKTEVRCAVLTTIS